MGHRHPRGVRRHGPRPAAQSRSSGWSWAAPSCRSRFGGEADNILYAGTEEQKQRYLIPTIEGERRSCFAITEPGRRVGRAQHPHPRGPRRRRLGDQRREDLHHRRQRGRLRHGLRRHRPDKGVDGGVTASWSTGRWAGRPSRSTTMGEGGPASLVFEDVRVPEPNILGELGQGFDLAMQWIGQGPLHASRPAGRRASAERLLQMAIDYAKIRESMGQPIARVPGDPVDDRRLPGGDRGGKWLTLHAAWRSQQGMDPRHATSIAKLYGAQHGQPGRRPGAADPRRHGLHQGAADRALVPRAARCCASSRAPTRSSAARSPATCSRATPGSARSASDPGAPAAARPPGRAVTGGPRRQLRIRASPRSITIVPSSLAVRNTQPARRPPTSTR